jgi:hypothetical protein
MKTFPIEIGGEVLSLTLREAFALAEHICASAYAAQCGPASDDIAEDRDAQRQAREKRHASAFEELYCALRDIADDWHREAIRRRDGAEPGQFEAAFCDPTVAIERTLRTALQSVKDWDY